MSMPFGLKSAQATYQHCLQNCLHNQIGRNVHAYVDDIVVKSRKKETLLEELKETYGESGRKEISQDICVKKAMEFLVENAQDKEAEENA